MTTMIGFALGALCIGVPAGLILAAHGRALKDLERTKEQRDRAMVEWARWQHAAQRVQRQITDAAGTTWIADLHEDIASLPETGERED